MQTAKLLISDYGSKFLPSCLNMQIPKHVKVVDVIFFLCTQKNKEITSIYKVKLKNWISIFRSKQTWNQMNNVHE